MRVEIIRVNPDGTERDVWGFMLAWEFGSVGDMVCYLQAFRHQTKRKRQRLWRTVTLWDKLDTRDSTLKVAPPVPEDILAELKVALRKLVDNLEVQP